MSTNEYVDKLLTDAKLVADFGLRAGLFDDGELYKAIANVEQPPAKEPYSPEVVELQKAMNKASEIVPFSTLVELRKGWEPGAGKQPIVRLTALILLSLAAMFLVGSFSQTYNRGVVLLTELQAVAVIEPNTRYGQLVRQLVASRKEMAETSTEDDGDRLKQEAYFQNFEELQRLDFKVASLYSRVEKFKSEAEVQFANRDDILYAYYLVTDFIGIEDKERDLFFKKYDKDSLPYQGPEPESKSASTSLDAVYLNCPKLKQHESYVSAQENYIREKIGANAGFISLTKEYSYEKAYLSCFERFSAETSYMADIDTWIRDINRILAPYNLWLLPALFGALGAMIFHLRQIAQPLEPNPSSWKIIYRVTFGALAGMALAWFWVPEVRFGVDLPNVGFGLFAMSFVVGFSLDVFFSMLDRFRELANSAVGNIGAQKNSTA